MGTRVHDTLEEIIHGTKTEADLKPALSAELDELDMLGIDFPKDRWGKTSIRDAWVKNMDSFCNTFKKPLGEFETELLFIYRINKERALMGYIDLIKHNKDGYVSVYDWKSSSQFSKEGLKEHGRQLVVYTVALEQMGYTVKEAAWIMLKYVEVKFMGKARSNSKNLTEIVKVMDRWKLVRELKPHLEYDLEQLGYDEADIEIMLGKADEEMSLDTLPEEIQKKYIIKPYVRKYEITDDLREEAIQYVNEMADLFESLDPENEAEWQPMEITKGSEFFCRFLCNHKKSCKYLERYNREQELDKMDDEELF